jgi:hypothetical protein
VHCEEEPRTRFEEQCRPHIVKFTLVKINTKRNTFPIPPYHVFKLNIYFMILSQLTQQLVYEMHAHNFLFVHV